MARGQSILVLCCIFYIFHSTYGAPSFVVTSTESSNGKEGGKDGASSKVLTVPEIYQMKVNSNVSNRFVHTTVISKVRNIAEKAQEAAFSIILPDNAFISGFVMEVDGKNYTAHVKEKEEAKRDYDRAVSSGLGAAHVAVSARDSNRFTVSVNVEPATKAAFYLTYEELLKRKDGRYELLINIHPGQPVRDLDVEVLISESRKLIDVKAPPLRSGNEIGNEKDELDPRADIQIINEKEAAVRFSPNLELQKQLAHLMKTEEDEGLSAQFVVQYDVERDPTGGEVLIRDGYFVHFFAPSELQPLAKHVVFVLDTSGSMWNTKIKQLQEAMHKILEQLHENDTFSLIEFNSYSKVWDLNDVSKSVQYPRHWSWSYNEEEEDVSTFEFPSAYPANAAYIEKAKNSVSQFNADGGTNIYGALKVAVHIADREASRNNDENDRQPLIMFLTDGEATTGRTSLNEITNQLTKMNTRKTPLFCLSFGSGADKNFLQKLSLKNYGFSKHIYEGADASLQLQDFYNQISSPLLADVKFKYESSVKEVTKSHFPVFYDGSEMVVAGSYDLGRPVDTDTMVVSCIIGRRPTIYAPVIKPAISNVERLWAYLTIKQLLESKEISDGNTDELKQKALDLALKYSFVTPISSLVVVKPNATDAVDTEEASRGHRNYEDTLLMRSIPAARLPGPPGYSSGAVGLSGMPAGHYSAGPGVPVYAYSSRMGQPVPRIGGGPIQDNVLDLRIAADLDVDGSDTDQLAPNDLPWLNSILDNNGLLTLPSGTYKLGLNETIPDLPPCTNTPLNGSGLCTLLYDCPQVHSFLTSTDVYVNYFCILRNEYAGVCCPSVKV